jgi:nitrogen fixation/metabolism regulation signal transduction histidine kinase
VSDEPAPAVEAHTFVEDGTVRLNIRDNGTGFPEALLPRVFEPYVTTKAKGTGLGLAIVKKIIEEHGGRLAIENLKPRGACVCVTLPMADGVKET